MSGSPKTYPIRSCAAALIRVPSCRPPSAAYPAAARGKGVVKGEPRGSRRQTTTGRMAYRLGKAREKPVYRYISRQYSSRMNLPITIPGSRKQRPARI